MQGFRLKGVRLKGLSALNIFSLQPNHLNAIDKTQIREGYTC